MDFLKKKMKELMDDDGKKHGGVIDPFYVGTLILNTTTRIAQ